MPVGIQDDPAKVKPFQFGISATVTTTFRDRGKSQDNEIKHAFHASLNAPTTPVIVTALLDIGRGEWVRFTRHFDIYLTWLLDLFQMENRVIIYCDESVVSFLVNRVEIDWDRLQVVVISLRDLPFYRYREEIQKIIDAEQENWQDEWDLRIRDHPEAKFAEYDILVNSKPYLLKNATHISRFATEFFVWVDAGHGSQDVIPRGLWNPQLTPGKITLIKLTGTLDKAHRYTLDLVYRKERSVISGGFLAGDVATIQRLYVFFYITFMGLLDSGKVDDDQTTLLMTIRDYSSTFNILTGGWFDAFKIIPGRSAVADTF
ncbi:Protein T11F9.12 [Aphelenchoides avenae]|nr:Protein T11F9.12 [Aphelenchus avenae]